MMESHEDGMELFDARIQLNNLKDLQLERKELDKKIDQAIHQLEHKVQRMTLKPGHIKVDDGVKSQDPIHKKKDITTTRHQANTGETDSHLPLVSKSLVNAYPPNEGNGYRVHVAGFGANVKRDDLMQTFGRFGPITEIWMAQSMPRFGFVVFKNMEDSEEAIWQLDSSEICGNKIYVAPARPRSKGTGTYAFDPTKSCYLCGERGHFSRECPKSKGVMFPST